MAAPIATLAVRISAQISELQTGFKEGQKTVEEFKSSFERSASSIQNTIAGIGDMFKNFGSSVGAITLGLGAVTAGAAAFSVAFSAVKGAVEGVVATVANSITTTADLGDNLLAMSQQTNLSVESLSAFKYVAGQANTSLDQIAGSVFKLEANLGKGTKETTDALASLGLSLKDLKASSPEQAFATILDKLGQVPDASKQAAAGMALFGKSFKDIAQLTKEDLAGLIDEAREIGVVMSTETAVAGDRLNDAFGKLHATLDGVTQRLGAKLLPAAVAITETFGGVFVDAIQAAVKASGGLGSSFDTVIAQIGQAIGRGIELLALFTDAIAAWVTDSVRRIAAEANAFLDLLPVLTRVGKTLDLILNGGTHGSALDQMAASLEKLRTPLAAVATTAGHAGDAVRVFATQVADGARAAGDNFGATYQRIQREISTSADAMRSGLKKIGAGLDEVGTGASDAFASLGKQLATLTQQITRAAANKTGLSDLVKLFGDQASKATSLATAFGIGVSAAVQRVAAAFDRAKLSEQIEKFSDSVKVASGVTERELASIGTRFTASAATLGIGGAFDKLNDGVLKMGSDLAKKLGDRLKEGMSDAVPAVLSNIAPIKSAFVDFGKTLPDLIFGTLQHGGNLVGAIAAGLGATFAKKFADAVAAAKQAGTAISGSNAALGAIGTGLSIFTGGYGIGAATGSKTKGALGGAASGALAGAAFGSAVPVIGTGIGAVVGGAIGLFGGLLGGSNGDKEAKAALEQNKQALAEQYGGMQKLTELANKLGVDIGKAFDAKKPEQFQSAVDKLNAAIERQNTAMEGLGRAVEGVNAKATAFSAKFADLIAKKTELLNGRSASDLSGSETDAFGGIQAQLTDLAAQSQPEFERLGVIVRDTFAAMVRDSGDAIAALQALAPAFTTLQSGVSDFGLTSTAAIDELLKSFALVNDKALAPLLQNVQSAGQVFSGLFDAKALSIDGFQAIAADIGASLQGIADQGGDVARAMALSQPVLQKLWEAQQTYGAVTDDTTAALLHQAEQQGLVGEQMRDANERILDVLVAIGDALGAKIPNALRGLPPVAQEAAAGMSDAFSKTFTKLPKDAAEAGAGIHAELSKRFQTTAADAAAKFRDSFNGLSGAAAQAAKDVNAAFSGIHLDPLNIEVRGKFRYEEDGLYAGQRDYDVALAKGGVVSRPTLALVGEAGPEAVLPLSALSRLSGGGSTTVVLEMDGRRAAEVVVPHIPGVVKRFGL